MFVNSSVVVPDKRMIYNQMVVVLSVLIEISFADLMVRLHPIVPDEIGLSFIRTFLSEFILIHENSWTSR